MKTTAKNPTLSINYLVINFPISNTCDLLYVYSISYMSVIYVYNTFYMSIIRYKIKITW